MSDVCLILEGTYPYVTGGVSTWVHNLISALPQVRFSIMAILPTTQSYRDYKYDVPENVVSISNTYIHEYELSSQGNRGNKKKIFPLLKEFHDGVRKNDYTLLPEIYRQVMDPKTRVISPNEIFFHKGTWEMLVRRYNEKELSDSFIDYIWTWRYSHLPLFRLMDSNIPKAKIYHTISTGYAGFIASLAKIKTGSPMLLTEHGIYTNERRIEIEQSRWIYERAVDRTVITETTSPFKEIWIKLFESLSGITYLYADEIITLFENNRKMQILEGAPPERTRIIPNGIDLSRFPFKKKDKKPGDSFKVGFVGRIVPIKDVKTFLRACKLIKEKKPKVKFYIMGPTDEDEEYFNECRQTVSLLGLEDDIEFTGRVNVRERYPELDVVVLTSVSEAQPLVILEANCSGLPCVATDVGACPELLLGRTVEDKAIGKSGLITRIADPADTAAAVLRILGNDSLRKNMGETGIRRVERFYNEQDLNFSYLELYRKYFNV